MMNSVAHKSTSGSCNLRIFSSNVLAHGVQQFHTDLCGMSSVLGVPLPSAQPYLWGELDEKLGETRKMKSLMKPLLLVMGVALLAALGTSPLMAQTVIDPQLYVCTGCTSPTSPPGDPNVINPASINVGFAGSHTAVSPLLIIVGVPNAGPAPTISLPEGVNPAAAGAYYGLNFATSGTTAGVFEGSLTNANMGNNNAYAVSGLNTGAGGGSSESWVNWTTFDTGKGIPFGSSFSLYGYAINFALNSDSKNGAVNSPITIDFSGINAGSFVVAYNCAMAGSTCTDGDIGETPFTQAGAVVPEPGSMLLMGSGLLGLAGMLRRRRKLNA